MIKSVVFDIDNTMYSYDKYNAYTMDALTVYARAKLRLDEKEFLELYKQADRNIKDNLHTDCAAIHNRLIRIQEILRLCGKPLHPHALNLYHMYWKTLIAYAEAEPGLIACLEDLKERQIKIGVISDMTAYIQYEKLEKLGVLPYVDYITTSEEAGVEKPHPDIFKLAIKKCGFLPKECIYVGDSLKKDVMGAHNCGMKAVWYTGCLSTDLPKTPEFAKKIDCFKELKPIIESFEKGETPWE